MPADDEEVTSYGCRTVERRNGAALPPQSHPQDQSRAQPGCCPDHYLLDGGDIEAAGLPESHRSPEGKSLRRATDNHEEMDKLRTMMEGAHMVEDRAPGRP